MNCFMEGPWGRRSTLSRYSKYQRPRDLPWGTGRLCDLPATAAQDASTHIKIPSLGCLGQQQVEWVPCHRSRSSGIAGCAGCHRIGQLLHHLARAGDP